MVQGVDPLITRADVQDFFPELAESEDEKIRRCLIAIITDFESLYLQENYSLSREDVIAWLEKQGEPKLAIFIPKFRVGDKLVSTKNPRLTYEVLEVGHINELGNPEYKVEIFTDGKAENHRNIHYMECYKVDEWAKLIEQKTADWSEDDEAMLGWCISDIERAKYCKSQTKPELCDIEINWLKNIKDRVQPQSQWKPSVEQIKVCKEVYADILSAKGFDLGTVNSELNRLEEQLKQL